MLNIFAFEFMQRAFVAGIAIAITAPLIGNFLVVRRYSLMADTLAHVSLAGVAIGLLTKQQPLLTAVIASVAAAVAIETLSKNKKIFGESVLALFLSGSLAVATIILSISGGFNVDLLSLLFGSITTVSSVDLWFITALAVLVILTITVLYKELFFASFDEQVAAAAGLRTRTMHLILVILAAITVSLAIRIVGILLIGALMVIPVITAMQYRLSFKRTMGLSVLFSLVAIITGLMISFYLNLPSGGTIVMIALGLFLLSLRAKKTS